MRAVRSIIALLAIGVGIAVCTPLVIIISPGPYRWRWAIARAWARYALGTLRVICGLDYRVRGAQHLATGGPAVVFCKHQSAWETIAMIAICPAHSWVLKRELMWVPFLGWALAVMRPAAIRRGTGRSAVNQVVEQGRRILASGRWVMVFPEGTRLPPFVKSRFGVGGAVLATETGVPVIPIAVNAGHFWPRKGMIRRGGVVDVVIGSPIRSRGKSVAQLNAEAKEWIDATMDTLEPPPA